MLALAGGMWSGNIAAAGEGERRSPPIQTQMKIVKLPKNAGGKYYLLRWINIAG
jgi:hypothetical protein